MTDPRIVSALREATGEQLREDALWYHATAAEAASCEAEDTGAPPGPLHALHVAAAQARAAHRDHVAATVRAAAIAEVRAVVEGVTRFRSCPCGRDTLTAIRTLTEAK